MLVLVKLAVAACALVLAVISIGFETVDRSISGNLLRRMRITGYVGIVAAIGLFLFGGINEYYSNQGEQLRQAQIASLSGNLDKANSNLIATRNSLEIAVTVALRSRQAISLLEEASRGQLARVAYVEHQFAILKSIDTELVSENGDSIRPKAGDEIRWTISCSGAIPKPDQLVDVDWCGAGYGDLIANAYKFPVTGVSGRKTYIGTRSTGGALVYERPYDSCMPLYAALVQSRCSIEFQVYRKLSDIQLDILDRKGYRSIATGDPRDSKICQMYERLFPNKSCDDLVR